MLDVRILWMTSKTIVKRIFINIIGFILISSYIDITEKWIPNDDFVYKADQY